MSVTYQKPDRVMLRALAEALEHHHPRLLAAGVEVTLLAAFGPVDEDGETVGPALKLHGVPALGVTRIVPLKHRVAGLGDAEILIDGDAWADMDPRRRVALLDHELTHLEPILEAPKRRRPSKRQRAQLAVVPTEAVVEAKPLLDSAGRPKLRMRHHDRSFGWFDSVAKRHGGDSFEVQQAREFAAEAGQLYFPELGPGGKAGRS